MHGLSMKGFSSTYSSPPPRNWMVPLNPNSDSNTITSGISTPQHGRSVSTHHGSDHMPTESRQISKSRTTSALVFFRTRKVHLTMSHPPLPQRKPSSWPPVCSPCSKQARQTPATPTARWGVWVNTEQETPLCGLHVSLLLLLLWTDSATCLGS